MGREGGERGRQPFYTPPILGACDRSHGSRIIYTLLGKQHGWLAARGKVPLCEGAVTTSQMRSEVDLATRRGLSTISAGVFKSPPRRPVLVYPGLCFAGIGFLLLSESSRIFRTGSDQLHCIWFGCEFSRGVGWHNF
jgi:hypothetical protein